MGLMATFRPIPGVMPSRVSYVKQHAYNVIEPVYHYITANRCIDCKLWYRYEEDAEGFGECQLYHTFTGWNENCHEHKNKELVV